MLESNQRRRLIKTVLSHSANRGRTGPQGRIRTYITRVTVWHHAVRSLAVELSAARDSNSHSRPYKERALPVKLSAGRTGDPDWIRTSRNTFRTRARVPVAHRGRWQARSESNARLLSQSQMFSPLNYAPALLGHRQGFEPCHATLEESVSFLRPVHGRRGRTRTCVSSFGGSCSVL